MEICSSLFSEKTQKCFESPEMARKLIDKCFNIFTPSHTYAKKKSASVDGGLSGGSSVRRLGSGDPHRRTNIAIKIIILLAVSWALFPTQLIANNFGACIRIKIANQT
jgi:hypothetical protein